MFQPLISICIPAYKKPEFVVRCLNSITQQSYKYVEVIISDDSPNEDIKVAIEPFRDRLLIKYFRNQPSLKSPKNWNNAIDKSTGEFYILMHQDDWFHDSKALSIFLSAFEENINIDFVFCQNTAIEQDGKKIILQARPKLLNNLLSKPDHLLLAQVIGPPSNTMIRKSVTIRYDERLIWLVDVDFYNRLLKAGHKYIYLEKHLVSIGLHQDQTTVYCRENDEIILKENILFAGKIGPKAFNDVLIYDYYWRLLRNFKIRSIADLELCGLTIQEIPTVIKNMLLMQKNISLSQLNNGFISKTSMLISYLFKKREDKR